MSFYAFIHRQEANMQKGGKFSMNKHSRKLQNTSRANGKKSDSAFHQQQMKTCRSVNDFELLNYKLWKQIN